MADRSRRSITSTTNRARCLSGSHSSTDGGSRKPVSRSIGRKLLMQQPVSEPGANHPTNSTATDRVAVIPSLGDQTLFVGQHPRQVRAAVTLHGFRSMGFGIKLHLVPGLSRFAAAFSHGAVRVQPASRHGT